MPSSVSPGHRSSKEGGRAQKSLFKSAGRAAAHMDAFLLVASRARDTLDTFMPQNLHGNTEGVKERTTVGLVVKGSTVDGLVVGSPAFLCRKLRKGDVILKVDGHEATAQSLARSLDPGRPAGSMVSLEFMSQIPDRRIQDVTLAAITMQEASQRCNTLKLLEMLKDDAINSGNLQASALAEDIGAHLVKAFNRVSSVQSQIWRNFSKLKEQLSTDINDLDAWMSQLYALIVSSSSQDDEISLDELPPSSPMTPSTSAPALQIQEAEQMMASLRSERDVLQARLNESDAKVVHLQDDLRDVQRVIEPLNQSKLWLEKRVRGLEEGLAAPRKMERMQGSDTPLNEHAAGVHLQGVVQALDNDKRNLEAALLKSQSEVTDLQGKASKLSSELRQSMAQIAELQHELGASIKARESLANENARLLALETEHDKLQREIDLLKTPQTQEAASQSAAAAIEYGEEGAGLSRAELAAANARLQSQLDQQSQHLQSRLQNSKVSIARLMEENKDLRQELEAARNSDHEVRVAPLPKRQSQALQTQDRTETPLLTYSKTSSPGPSTPSIQFSKRSSRVAEEMPCIGMDTDDESEESEDEADSALKSALVERDAALSDRSKLESLLRANQVTLAEQTLALDKMEETAVENSLLKDQLATSKAEGFELRIRVHDLTMSTGKLEEELSEMMVQLNEERSLSDAKANARSEAGWCQEEKLRRLDAELHEQYALTAQLSAELNRADAKIQAQTTELGNTKATTDADSEERVRLKAMIDSQSKAIQQANAQVREMEARLQGQGAALMAAKDDEVENALALVRDRDAIDGERCKSLVRLVQRLEESLVRLDEGHSNVVELAAREAEREKHKFEELQASVAAKTMMAELAEEKARLLQMQVGEILQDVMGAKQEAALEMHVHDSNHSSLQRERDHLKEALDVAKVSKARKQTILEELQRQVDASSLQLEAHAQVQQELAECREQLERCRSQEVEASRELASVRQEHQAKLAVLEGQLIVAMEDRARAASHLSDESKRQADEACVAREQLERELEQSLSQLASLSQELAQVRAEAEAASARQRDLDACVTELAQARRELEEEQADKSAALGLMAEEVARGKSDGVEAARCQELLEVCKAQLSQVQEQLSVANLKKTEAEELVAVYKQEVKRQ